MREGLPALLRQSTSPSSRFPRRIDLVLPMPFTRHDVLFLVILVAYGLVHIVIRLTISAGAELDEAEQLLLSQSLALGYTDQPPLYTWLLLLVQGLCGVNVLSLVILKHLLLFGTYVCLFLAGREVLHDAYLALLTALSLWLIPQIAWESYRDLTHSVLVTSLSAGCVYVVLALQRHRQTWYYAMLGLLLGLGTLAKYNFLLFAGAWLGAALAHRDTRDAVLNRRIWLSVGVAAVIVFPHFLWWLDHIHLDASPTLKKLARQEGFRSVLAIGIGLFRLAWASVSFLTPLWLVCLLALPAATWRRQPVSSALGGYSALLERFFLLIFSLLSLAVVLFGVTHFKDRWMQPFLFLTPLYVFVRAQRAGITPAYLRWYARVLVVAGGVFLMVPLAQAWVVPWFGMYSRLHVPFAQLAPQFQAAGFRHGMIVAESIFLGGNLRLTFPQTRVLTPDLPSRIAADAREAGQCLLVWDGSRTASLPASLQRFIESDLRAQVPIGMAPGSVEAPLMGSSEQRARLGFMLFPGGLGACR